MYRLTKSSSIIIRTEDGAYIPVDPNNRDYADYLAWVADGNAPGPYVPPKPTLVTIFSTLDYFSRFTDSEYAAVRQGPIALQRGLDSMIAAQYVDVADPRVDQYLSALVAAGIIDAARKAELLQAEAT